MLVYSMIGRGPIGVSSIPPTAEDVVKVSLLAVWRHIIALALGIVGVVITLPPLAAQPTPLELNPTLIRTQCEIVHDIEDQAILYGVVVDRRSGTPLPGSTVHLSWGTIRTQNNSTIHQTTTITENGIYIFCDVPQATRLSAWGETLGLTSQRAEFFFEEGESTREDLRIQIRSVYGAISGVILDAVTQEPIEAATITLTAADASTLTNSNGRFQFDEVPIGAHEAIIHHVAYGDPSLTLTVSPTLNTYVNIELDPRPVALEPISVEVTVRQRWLDSNGFYDRQSRSLGQFVTPEEIDRQPYRTFAEVLRTLPGVNLRTVCTPHCAVLIRMASSTQVGCIPTFYIDGTKISQLTNPNGTIDLDMLVFGHDLAAVELYRGIAETPPQFYGRCGSVVIWTRRGLA